MSCTSPVVNGCNAKCCENFSFPYSPSDLQQMIPIIEENKDKELSERPKDFINQEGRKIVIIYDPQVKQIADMLIYLGETQLDPQQPFATKGEIYRYKNQIPEDEVLTMPIESSILFQYNKLYWMWNFVKEGEIYGHSFTCKHFDTEKRICNDYENRPNMCRNFGRGCKYEGCGFDNQLKIEEQRDVLLDSN